MDEPTVSQLAQAVHSLASTLSEVQSEVAQLKSEIQQLKISCTQSPTLEPRTTPVSPFSGEPRLGRGFLAQCEITFSLQPSRFSSDAARIGFIASALSSRALEWYTAVATRAPTICQDYLLFRERFLTVFSLPEEG